MRFMIRHFRAMAENEYAPNLNTVTTNDCQDTSAYSKGLFQERCAQNTLRRVTGQAGVWTGMGMGWGLQRGNWGQSLFAPRPVQPLLTLLQHR